MDTIKRSSELSNHDKKKLIKIYHTEKNKTTNFESLSNELFYEIFEHLDGYDIYKAFSNLNSRFERLITCSSLPIKVKLPSDAISELKNCCTNLIIPYRHRIFSLEWENQSVIDDFFTYCLFDSSFDYLQSIVISEVSINKVMMLLFYFKSLPRLSSLTMNIHEGDSNDLRDIYRMIFSLPYLKYNKLSLFWFFSDDSMNASIPLAINEQPSTIEYLDIDHRCTVNALLSMLSHTPRLHHLDCDNFIELEFPVGIGQSLVLSNLSYLRLDTFFGDFDDFEMFMAKLLAPIQILIIDTVFDETFFDADRWERFIMKHMLHLRQLKLTSSVDGSIDFGDAPLNDLINHFTSSFWIQYQWFFEVKIEYNTIYSIRPCKNLWLDIYKNSEIATYCNKNISDNSMQPIQLVITENDANESHQSFFDNLKSKFMGAQFTRLVVNCKNIPAGLLIKIIDLLPSLVSLKVSSLPMFEPVNLENTMNIEQVHFMLYLCIQIQYFQLDVPKNIDLSTFLRFILIKAGTYNPRLNALCLTFSIADEEMVHRSETIIESEKLLSNYQIKRVGNQILLRWTSH